MATAPAKDSAPRNGSAPTVSPNTDDLATVIAYEGAIADEAEAVFDGENYEGRITARILMQLRPLLTRPIPHLHIKHVAKGSSSYKDRNGNERPWPPHDITGINGSQVQATRLSNVVGRQHWRKLVRHFKEGQLCRVHVLIGNDLALAELDERGDLHPNGAEILVAEDGWGSYNKGFDTGYHYKGSETSAIKKVFARVGVGEEVYRQEVDPELDPDEHEAPSPDLAAVQAIPTIDGDRVAKLTDIAQAWVTAVEGDEQKKRTTQITRLLRSEGLTGEIESVTQGFARLTPVQADNVEKWLREQSKDGDQS